MENKMIEIEGYFITLPFEVKKKKSDNIYYFDYEGTNGSWIVFLEFNIKAKSITFYAQLKAKVVEEKIDITRNFLNECNFVVPIGCFALDVELGTLNYKIVQKYYTEVPIINVTQDILNVGLRLIDDYMAGINLVMTSETDLSVAMQRIYEEQDSYDIFIL